MSSIDVLIIAALSEEHDAARSAGNGVRDWREEGSGTTTPYLVGECRTPSGRPLTMALARPTAMGGRKTGPLHMHQAGPLQYA